MSTGTWDPTAGTESSDVQLTPELLKRLAAMGHAERVEALEEKLDPQERQSLALLMQIDHALWLESVGELDDATLLNLIRFFALAENFPGWEAGAGSPVIPLAKTLRQRGQRLDKPLLQWLREVNENRYLPYGPL